MPFDRRVGIWEIAGGVLLGTLGAHAVEFAAADIWMRVKMERVEGVLQPPERMRRQPRHRDIHEVRKR